MQSTNHTPADAPSVKDHEVLAYSVKNAARVSSICRTRLYALAKEGRLEMRKIGGRTLIPAASLRRLIDGEA